MTYIIKSIKLIETNKMFRSLANYLKSLEFPIKNRLYMKQDKNIKEIIP